MNPNIKDICQWCLTAKLPITEEYYLAKGNICAKCDAKFGKQAAGKNSVRKNLVKKGIINDD